MKQEQVQVVLALGQEWPDASVSEIAKAMKHALEYEDPCDTINLHLRASEWLNDHADSGADGEVSVQSNWHFPASTEVERFIERAVHLSINVTIADPTDADPEEVYLAVLHAIEQVGLGDDVEDALEATALAKLAGYDPETHA